MTGAMARDWSSRRRVWAALSDVFLDTETRWAFPSVALTLLESPFSPAEQERIWRYEAVPEFRSNVLTMFGEWAVLPLDEASLRRRARRAPTLWTRWWLTAPRWLTSQWRGIVILRERLAVQPVESRSAYADAWSVFSKVYLEGPTSPGCTTAHTDALRATGLSPDALSSTFEEDFRPVYRDLLIDEERRSEVQRAEHVFRTIALVGPAAARR